MKGLHAAGAGRLTADAEIRTSAKGRRYLRLAVLVDDVRDTHGSQDDNAAEWVNVSAFVAEAELDELVTRLPKGGTVYFEGTAKVKPWRANDGALRAGLSVLAWRVEPLGEIGQRRRQSTERSESRPTSEPRPSTAEPRPTSTATSRPRREREARPTGDLEVPNRFNDDDVPL